MSPAGWDRVLKTRVTAQSLSPPRDTGPDLIGLFDARLMACRTEARQSINDCTLDHPKSLFKQNIILRFSTPLDKSEKSVGMFMSPVFPVVEAECPRIPDMAEIPDAPSPRSRESRSATVRHLRARATRGMR